MEIEKFTVTLCWKSDNIPSSLNYPKHFLGSKYKFLVKLFENRKFEAN